MFLPVAQQLEEELNKLPSLIRRIEQSSSPNVTECDQWLSGVITLCEKYYLPIATELALIKGKLSFYAKPKELDRHEGKRACTRYVLESLDKAQKLVKDYFASFHQTVSVCESACLQTISAVWASGMFGETVPSVDMIWRMSDKEPELRKAISQIVGMVGTSNAKILLDRAIPQVYIEREGQ